MDSKISVPAPSTTGSEGSSLAELLQRVEAATGPDRELDLDLSISLGLAPTGDQWKRRNGRYDQGGAPYLRKDLAPAPGPWPLYYARPITASIDAALALGAHLGARPAYVLASCLVPTDPDATVGQIARRCVADLLKVVLALQASRPAGQFYDGSSPQNPEGAS